MNDEVIYLILHHSSVPCSSVQYSLFLSSRSYPVNLIFRTARRAAGSFQGFTKTVSKAKGKHAAIPSQDKIFIRPRKIGIAFHGLGKKDITHAES
jgi:hypothetical protein